MIPARFAGPICVIGLLLGAAAHAAEDALDTMDLRFAQAKPLSSAPASRDELFGPAPKPQTPASKDELFGPAPASVPKAKAPVTKDELFGAPARPAPAAPSVRDELFGPAPAASAPQPAQAASTQGFKWGGFFSEEVAYTVGEPKHWSRAVSRLQLSGQGELNGLKYKVSARVDADPVYFDSDAYPEDVRHDQRLDFFLRENYIDFSAGSLDIRLGRQQIVWGEVVGLFFADVVSGRDLRDFILPSFDIMRIPQWALRAEYFKGDFHAEAIWVPVQSLDNIGEAGSEFYPVGLMDTPNSVYRDVDEPSHNLSNSAYGLRLNTLVDGWDMAAFYYRSFTSSPTFYREIVGDNAVFTPRHDRIWKMGSTVSKDFGDFVLRGEAVYTDGQTFSVESLLDRDGVVRRNFFEYIVGLDFSLPHDTRLNVQGFQRFIAGDDDDIRPEVGGAGFTVLLSRKLNAFWEPQILWIQGEAGDRLVRPRVNWYAARNTLFSFGADIFSGPDTGMFGRYDNRDRIYGEMRYDF